MGSQRRRDMARTVLFLVVVWSVAALVAAGWLLALEAGPAAGPAAGLAAGLARVEARAVLVLPFALLALVLGLRRLDAGLARIARSLGAGPLAVFRRVVLPDGGAFVLGCWMLAGCWLVLAPMGGAGLPGWVAFGLLVAICAAGLVRELR